MSSNLNITIAKDEYGKDLTINLTTVKHMLVAGCTGSGKSVLLHKIIGTLLSNNSPDDVKLILIDPKRVELTLYRDIPHSLTPVIIETKKAILAMKWLVKEMDRRYEILKDDGCKNIAEYQGKEYMPAIVTVVDEFSDLIQTYPKETESPVLKIAEMGHVVGIHIILSTSKLGTKVITKDIRNVIGSRIALQTVSKGDSNTIIGNNSAYALHGAGDMLYRDGMKYVVRGQAELVDHFEIKKLCKSLQTKHKEGNQINITEGSVEDSNDELYEQAKEITLQAGKTSTSYIQRKLRIGYSRSARLMDLLEINGVIGPAEGAEPRNVIEKRTK